MQTTLTKGQCLFCGAPAKNKYCSQEHFRLHAKSEHSSTSVATIPVVNEVTTIDVPMPTVEPPLTNGPTPLPKARWWKREPYALFREWAPVCVCAFVIYASGWAFARQSLMTFDFNVWNFYGIGAAIDIGLVICIHYMAKAARLRKKARLETGMWLVLSVISATTQWYYYTLETQAPIELAVLRIAGVTAVNILCAFGLRSLEEVR